MGKRVDKPKRRPGFTIVRQYDHASPQENFAISHLEGLEIKGRVVDYAFVYEVCYGKEKEEKKDGWMFRR